jgi:hypothetical protein
LASGTAPTPATHRRSISQISRAVRARACVCVCCAVLRMHAYSQLTHTPDDYDAPVSEDGSDGYGSDGVNKFDALKDAIAKVGGRILWVCVSIRACRRRQCVRPPADIACRIVTRAPPFSIASRCSMPSTRSATRRVDGLRWMCVRVCYVIAWHLTHVIARSCSKRHLWST